MNSWSCLNHRQYLTLNLDLIDKSVFVGDNDNYDIS